MHRIWVAVGPLLIVGLNLSQVCATWAAQNPPQQSVQTMSAQEMDQLRKHTMGLYNESTAPLGFHWIKAKNGPQLRREFAAKALMALKTLVDYGVPDENNEPVEVRDIRLVSAPLYGEDSYREAMMKKLREAHEARKNVVALDLLWIDRITITQGIVNAYRKEPHATEELRELATSSIHNDAVVRDLIAKVEAKERPLTILEMAMRKSAPAPAPSGAVPSKP